MHHVDEKGFHSAIDRAPNDLTSRLVYGDWLDEQDTPESRMAAGRQRAIGDPWNNDMREQWATLCHEAGQRQAAEFIRAGIKLSEVPKDVTIPTEELCRPKWTEWLTKLSLEQKWMGGELTVPVDSVPAFYKDVMPVKGILADRDLKSRAFKKCLDEVPKWETLLPRLYPRARFDGVSLCNGSLGNDWSDVAFVWDRGLVLDVPLMSWGDWVRTARHLLLNHAIRAVTFTTPPPILRHTRNVEALVIFQLEGYIRPGDPYYTETLHDYKRLGAESQAQREFHSRILTGLLERRWPGIHFTHNWKPSAPATPVPLLTGPVNAALAGLRARSGSGNDWKLVDIPPEAAVARPGDAEVGWGVMPELETSTGTEDDLASESG